MTTRATGSSIVTKCTNIIDILVEARRPLTFSEIVEATGYVKSSAHRLLAVLLSENLASYDDHTRTYSTGQRIGYWSRVAWLRIDIQKLAEKELEKLCDETGMDVALSVLDNNSILYLRTADTAQLRFAARAGDHAPLHCTAAGKVFLAYMPERKRASFFKNHILESQTEYTICQPELLTQELQQIREQGYGLAIHEELPKVQGIAAPIWDQQQNLTGCLSIWCRSDERDIKKMQQLAPALLAATKRISQQMG